MVMEQGSGDERQGPGGQEEQVGGQRLVDPRVLFESQRELGRGIIPGWVVRGYRDLIFKYIPDKPAQKTNINNRSVKEPPENDTP